MGLHHCFCTALAVFLALTTCVSAHGAMPTGRALHTHDRDTRAAFELAIGAYAEAEFVRAERLFHELEGNGKLAPGDGEIVRFMIGKCLYAQGEYDFAARHFDAFRVAFPNSDYEAAAYVIGGHCAFRRGDYPAAAREYAFALRRGRFSHRRIALANLRPLMQRGLRSHELESVLDILVDDSLSAQVRFWIAERWEAAGRRLDAARLYRQAAQSLSGDQAGIAVTRAKTLEHPVAWSLVIGVLTPLSGDYSGFGADVLTSARMAADRWGQAVRLVTADTRGEPIRAAWLVDSLVDLGCDAVVGPLRSECVAATAAVLRDHNIVQILPVARRGGSELTGLSPHLYILSVPPDRRARRLAEAAMRNDGMRRFAALIADTPEGRAAGSAFATQVLGNGGVLYPIQYFTPAMLDFSRQLRRLKRVIRDDLEKPLPTAAEEDDLAEGEEKIDVETRYRVELDGILLWGDPEDILQLVPQVRALGFRGRFLGNAGWDDHRLTEVIPGAVDSILFISDERIDPSSVPWRRFAAEFNSRTARRPNWLAGRVYDAINWLADQTAGSPDPAAPLKHLGAAAEFEGVVGTYHLAADRQPGEATIYRYVHGRPQLVRDQEQ